MVLKEEGKYKTVGGGEREEEGSVGGKDSELLNYYL